MSADSVRRRRVPKLFRELTGQLGIFRFDASHQTEVVFNEFTLLEIGKDRIQVEWIQKCISLLEWFTDWQTADYKIDIVQGYLCESQRVQKRGEAMPTLSVATEDTSNRSL